MTTINRGPRRGSRAGDPVAEHAELAEKPIGGKPCAAISWSGGKDSCAALVRARESFDVSAMVTMFDEEAARSRSHGLRPEVLAAPVVVPGKPTTGLSQRPSKHSDLRGSPT